MPSLLRLALLDPRLNKLRYAFAIAMFLSIIVTGSIPGVRAGVGQYASGMVLHSLAYATLTLLWFTASRGSAASRSLAAVLAVAVMGAIDELVQSLFPFRGADIGDWMVDCSAAIVTCAVLWLVLPKWALQRS